jgi:hypothetical protein
MSFLTFELSRLLGRPVELYKFVYGPGNSYFAYTNAEKPITYSGIVYNPLPINRSNIQVTGTLDKADLTVTMPHTAGLPNILTIYPPAQTVSLTIYQGHANDTGGEFLVMWVGRVIGCQRKASEASLTCQSFMTSLKRTGLRRLWMYGCPHVLYGTECGADKAGHTVASVIVSISTTSDAVALPAAWSEALGWDTTHFPGGTIEYVGTDGNNYVTTINSINSDGVTLNLAGPPMALAVGRAVNLVWGCDHTVQGGCAALGNTQNFGGQPWIPYTDPTGIFQNSTY